MEADFVFVEGNAPPRRPTIVDKFLEEEDITSLECSAFSPDLNPVENVCAMFERWVAVRHPPRNLLKGFGILSIEQHRISLSCTDRVADKFIVQSVQTLH
ncbi:hypothetical protein AVEN_77401-1 [Araneus ventricosus]|uniref:Tc1-like transposase DDE domain-containing protein n=1 Tax=Araneus ventricosus TaxID=182803 RepID=A0A4Y2CBC2_ARAVE|nr:hypothetical protein AVEN_77401-1 [Araneus ventricosus]